MISGKRQRREAVWSMPPAGLRARVAPSYADMERLRRQNQRPAEELAKARFVIEVQGEVSALLDEVSERADCRVADDVPAAAGRQPCPGAPSGGPPGATVEPSCGHRPQPSVELGHHPPGRARPLELVLRDFCDGFFEPLLGQLTGPFAVQLPWAAPEMAAFEYGLCLISSVRYRTFVRMEVGPAATESDRKAAWAESRVAEIMGVLNAATAELVSVLAEVLESESWAGYGYRSPEHWVTVKAGVSPRRAQSLVAMARRLRELPTVARAFAEGRLTEDSVNVVVAHTPAERDEEVAGFAPLMTVTQLSQVLRTVPKPETTGAADHQRPAEVTFGHEDDGAFFLRARGLAAEQGSVVAKALEASREALFASGTKDVTWADALERMAQAALDALNRGKSSNDRFQVMVHVQAETKAAALHLGPALDRAARRRLACGDASIRWVLDGQGRPIAYGRSQRIVSRVVRALVERRDGGCRVPGCGRRRGTEVHHILHWEDGGLTVLENLCCLCPAHHRLHHQGLLHIEGDPTTPDGLVFTDARGRPIRGPDPVPLAGSVAEAARALRLRFGSFEPPLGERLDPGAFGWN